VQTHSNLLLSSGDLIADRRFAWARACAAEGDLDGAAGLLAQALELAPQYAPAWFALGEIRAKLGDREGAAAAFGAARDADPEDRLGAALHLARLWERDGAVMPAAYVRTLFDYYAPGFDRSLVEGLNYRAPELLLAAVKKFCALAGQPIRFGTMLDLGCGTGLAGAAFRPYVEWLAGVDISPAMIAQARAKGLYDRLAAADLIGFLNSQATDGARHHLVVATDVLPYLSDLTDVAAGVANILEVGGCFACTLETHDGPGTVLHESLRYAHSAAVVRSAIENAGLQPLAIQPVSTRNEKGAAVSDLLVVASNGSRLGDRNAP
jgi:predicted TPR repeat methyltransferase